jgi:signal peptidase II
VDFLELPHWPIFNVADMCICAAAVSIIILSVIKNVAIDGSRLGRSAAVDDHDQRTSADG